MRIQRYNFPFLRLPAEISPRVSVIVPVRNGAPTLEACVSPLLGAASELAELIVVDDGSTDGTGALAKELGASVLSSSMSQGPAAARNAGARIARGEILLFVDADIAVRLSTVASVVDAFDRDPSLAALFGSYDDEPRERNFLSQYKNLFHHFTHQTSERMSASFWAGCGAIRRDVFRAVGGFDDRQYRRPATEDIELGWRLNRAGYKVELDPALQVKHLKKWTAASLLKADILDRAYPWSMLLMSSDAIPDDLNLRWRHRVSAALAGLLVAGMPFLFAWRTQFLGVRIGVLALAVMTLAVALLLVLNRRFYSFLCGARGVVFALRAIPVHLCYYFYSGATFAVCWVVGVFGGHLVWRRRRGTSAAVG